MKRICKLCHQEVDFSEPWCDHETMEESAWLDMRARTLSSVDAVTDEAVTRCAEQLGRAAGQALIERRRIIFDS